MDVTPTIAQLPSPVSPPPTNQQQQKNKKKEEEIAPEEAGREEVADTTVANLSSPWEYDEDQPYCAGCATEFSALNRRHHCRLCGKIFCGSCSKYKSLIPPSSIVLVPRGGKKATRLHHRDNVSFNPDPDPDRMLTYTGTTSLVGGGDDGTASGVISGTDSTAVLYGTGLEERFLLAREPLRVCQPCHDQLLHVQEELRQTNSNAMRYNHIDPTDARRLFNSPLAFTLGHEVRKAAYTLNNLLPMPKRGRIGAFVSTTSNEENWTDFGYPDPAQQCRDECTTISPNLSNVDGVRIPAKLLEEAKGIAVLTVCKGGFGFVGGEFGTGLAVARLSDGAGWSAPSAVGTAGLSWGALVGAQVSDHVFLLMTDDAVEMLFSDNGSIQLGADVGVAVGPVGRSLEGNVGAAPGKLAGIYTYSLSKGLYAGVSLDSKVIVTRHDVNERFYGRQVRGMELLTGAIPTPPAAQPLYDALTRCHVYASGAERPLRSSTTISALRTPGTIDALGMEYGEYVQNSMLDPNVSYPQTTRTTTTSLPPMPPNPPPMPPPMAPPDQHSTTGTVVSELTHDPLY